MLSKSLLQFRENHPLAGRSPALAVARFLQWKLLSRLMGGGVFSWIHDAKLAVETGRSGLSGNIYCGLYEPADMGFFLHTLKPGELFLDVGANAGAYTVLASKVCGARTLAFEPDEGTAAQLGRNVEINGITGLVQIERCALGDRDGVVRFTVGQDVTNQIATEADTVTQEVPIRKLDSVPGAQTASLMKMDVEGFEALVLVGASAVLASPTLLAIETEGDDEGVQDAMRANGFKRAFYDPFARRLSPEPLAFRAGNAIYVRDWEAVEARIASAPYRRVLGQSI